MQGHWDTIRKLQKVAMVLIGATMALMMAACGSSGGGTPAASTVQPPEASAQNGDVGTAQTVSEMEVGDLHVVSMTDGVGSVDFTGAPSSGEYLLIVGAANPNGSTSSVAVGDESAVEPLTKSLGIITNEFSTDVGEALDLTLRVAEEDLAAENLEPAENHLSASKAVTAATKVGDPQTFRVLSSLASTSAYTEVAASVVCVTDHLIVVLDDDDSEALTSDEIQDLCTRSEDATAAGISILGDPSDVNGDDHITYLWTHRVNQLGAQGGGIVTGFFYAADLYPRTEGNAISNEQEIVFALVPDPSGQYGNVISKSFAMNNLLTSVLPHEIQHAISYNQHVLLRGGSTEKTWLNEALSHNMECVTGYCQENPSRVAMYLASTETTSLVSGSSASLKQRGASFLFIRYLYEQSTDGNAFLNRIVGTNKTDVDNIETAFAGAETGFDQFEEFFFRWAIAVGVSGSGVISDARFTYRDRSFNTTTGQWGGACLRCDADDGRGTTLTGPNITSFDSSTALTLASTSVKYYAVTPQSSPMVISGASTANLQSVLVRTK